MFEQVGHWVVLEYGAPSGPLPLDVCHLFSVQPHVFLQQVFNLATGAVGKVNDLMSLVEDSTGLPSVGGQVIRDDASDLVVPSDLKNLIEDVTHRLPDLLVGYHINVVKDADGFGQLRNLDRIRVQRFVDFEAFGLILSGGSSEGRLEKR